MKKPETSSKILNRVILRALQNYEYKARTLRETICILSSIFQTLEVLKAISVADSIKAREAIEVFNAGGAFNVKLSGEGSALSVVEGQVTRSDIDEF